jgi:glucan 1,3-beta-glucosidase
LGKANKVLSLNRYYQPIPNAANSPYPRNATLNDPNYATSCLSGAPCDALGLRVLNSENTLIYGAGLYSFFNNYSTTCSNGGGPENCQSEIFSVEGTTSGISVTDLITVGAQNMIVIKGTSDAVYSANVNVYPDAIAYFTL